MMHCSCICNDNKCICMRVTPCSEARLFPLEWMLPAVHFFPNDSLIDWSFLLLLLAPAGLKHNHFQGHRIQPGYILSLPRALGVSVKTIWIMKTSILLYIPSPLSLSPSFPSLNYFKNVKYPTNHHQTISMLHMPTACLYSLAHCMPILTLVTVGAAYLWVFCSEGLFPVDQVLVYLLIMLCNGEEVVSILLLWSKTKCTTTTWTLTRKQYFTIKDNTRW